MRFEIQLQQTPKVCDLEVFFSRGGWRVCTNWPNIDQLRGSRIFLLPPVVSSWAAYRSRASIKSLEVLGKKVIRSFQGLWGHFYSDLGSRRIFHHRDFKKSLIESHKPWIKPTSEGNHVTNFYLKLKSAWKTDRTSNIQDCVVIYLYSVFHNAHFFKAENRNAHVYNILIFSCLIYI